MTLREVRYNAPGGGGNHAPYIPLSYYPGHWYSAWGVFQREGTWQTNTLRAFPFLVQRESQEFDAMGLEITTAQAGSTIQLGIYRQAIGGKPGDLMVDAGSVSGGEVSLQIVPLSGVVLGVGMWWLAAAIDVGASPSTLATRCWGSRLTSGSNTMPGMPAPAGVSSLAPQGWLGGANTTLVTPFPTSGLAENYVPKIMLRAADGGEPQYG